jgi:ABC-type multidrug transport system ATPase subunit
MVLGLSQPTAGEVEVFGMARRQAISRGLAAAVMQTGGLLNDLSVRETVQYTASLFADRIVLISNGIIVADGTGSEIKALASDRTLRATVTSPDTAALSRLGGVDRVEVRGEQVYVHAADSTVWPATCSPRPTPATFEITIHGLEDAFLA